jgi:hypothetical protein
MARTNRCCTRSESFVRPPSPFSSCGFSPALRGKAPLVKAGQRRLLMHFSLTTQRKLRKHSLFLVVLGKLSLVGIPRLCSME